MDTKELYKPNKLKTIITAILFLAPIILQFLVKANLANPSYGFPARFIQGAIYECIVGGPCPRPHYPSLVIDIIFSYLIALLIVLLYEKYIKSIRNNIKKSLLLSASLFLTFMIFGFIHPADHGAVGGAFKLPMIGFGSPLIFYAYDPLPPYIRFGSYFVWQYVIIDVVYWYLISILIIWAQNKFQSN